VVYEETFPIKIESITDIRYRWKKNEYISDGYIRFEFGNNYHLDVRMDDCSYTKVYNLEMGDEHARASNSQALEILKQAAEENCSLLGEVKTKASHEPIFPPLATISLNC